ncbi:transcription factor jumonji (jmj) family protein [Striga asiatica]|uniref:Transcription factor jumonji (Jmj) family protein n=1 Tax=Striga asiatica TaxID=4170 RepID=A0A5A7NVZ7_STRAF|nr:transcription factor jumonji (jmj) family protein [Striga asiatica]
MHWPNLIPGIGIGYLSSLGNVDSTSSTQRTKQSDRPNCTKIANKRVSSKAKRIKMFGFRSLSIVQVIEALDPHHECTEYWKHKLPNKKSMSSSENKLGAIPKRLNEHKNEKLQRF